MESKGGEVRRLHIIYFLSHLGGHAEHPHLIRVLHLTRNGVYLRGEKFIYVVSYFLSICSVLVLILVQLVFFSVTHKS
jgi:hypothetical protein